MTHSTRGMHSLQRAWLNIRVAPETHCWEWQAATLTSGGYGALRIGGRLGRTARVHRYFYEQYIGEVPDGLHVLHSCHNPKCCNPAHLKPGTDKDNSDDKIAAGRYRQRGSKGSDHPRTTLTETAVLEIRSSTESRKALARRFGVREHVIKYARSKHGWKHI